jgi:hypothetical protein
VICKSFFRAFIVLYALLSAQLPVFAQQKTIVFVSRPNYPDPATGEHSDQYFIDDLVNLGYNVVTTYHTALETASQATLDTLNNADLVIIGRSASSSDFQDAHKPAWNEITAPMILLQLWAARSSRLNWFNSETCLHYNDNAEFAAIIIEPDDPVFQGMYEQDQMIPWAEGAMDVIDIADAGNGLPLVIGEDNTVQFVRFEAGLEFYPGSTDVPAGIRSFIGNGNDNPTDDQGNHIFNYYNWSDQALQIYFNEVAYLTGTLTAVESLENPLTFCLNQNYPNPFNPETAISYALNRTDHIRLTIYDNLGRGVTTLVDEEQVPGQYRMKFDGRNLPSGVYLCTLSAGSEIRTLKMMMVK